ncbi:MAG: LamG-like jellyroll fold domain-containing protein [Bacteroidota bacterium]
MMKNLTFLLLFFSLQLSANIEEGLVAWLSFDKTSCQIADENGDPEVQTFVNGDLFCACGVRQNSLQFGGSDDWFYVFGPKVEDAFSTIDFSLSFYFKPTSAAPESQALFTKRLDCSTENAFSVRYNPFSRVLSVELIEGLSISGSITKTLPYSCWYHVVVIRKGATTTLWLNGEELGSTNAPASQRVDIGNDEPLIVGASNCSVDQDFEGFIDEIRIYDRAISRNDVQELYYAPDQIAIGIVSTGLKDTTIFLGKSVPAAITTSCANFFQWTPTTGVSDASIPNPLITPTETTTYALKFSDSGLCEITDSLRITVLDPSTLDCNDILLPTAFTPNDDGLNDGYGMSNPFVAGEILAFEIYDRWGNIVFSSINPLEKWDGSYKGKPVNPGVFLYRLNYRCEGVENTKTGSVTVIR